MPRIKIAPLSADLENERGSSSVCGALDHLSDIPEGFYRTNKGEKIGSLDVAISSDKSITINRLGDVATVTVRDRNTGKVDSETFFGDSPFGK